MARYDRWKSKTSLGAFSSSEARIHDVSLSVPAYPVQWTSYSSLHLLRRLSIVESRTLAISYSGSLSTKTGGGGGWTQSGITFEVASSNIETWNMGWMARRLSGRRMVTEYWVAL